MTDDPRPKTWRAPIVGGAAAASPGPRAERAGGVRGALGGSRLFEQPQYRAEVDAFRAFIGLSDASGGASGGAEAPGAYDEFDAADASEAGRRAAAPLAVEIGFDHGMRLLDLARTQPEVLWLGLEVREARVLAVAPHCPPNCHVWRADARTVFRVLMPAGRVSRVDVLFPTPWWDERKRDKRLLLTPEFVEDLSRALTTDGVVHVSTDVAPYFEHVAALFAGWRPAPAPRLGSVLSRRERVCRRDGLPIWSGTWGR